MDANSEASLLFASLIDAQSLSDEQRDIMRSYGVHKFAYDPCDPYGPGCDCDQGS